MLLLLLADAVSMRYRDICFAYSIAASPLSLMHNLYVNYILFGMSERVDGVAW